MTGRGGGSLDVSTDACATKIASAAQLACLLEASAPKPGNVSPGRHFEDAAYEDFLASAVAIGPAMAGAGGRPLGATIRQAVEATARWSRSNTNLGIVLLLAPIARAAFLARETIAGSCGVVDASVLRTSLEHVLAGTTTGDARDVYAAIRLAAPGGLGSAPEEDVASEPTRPLVEVMRLAAHRDAIAREYVTAFETTFSVTAPALARARRDALPWSAAIVETFLVLLAAQADTHVERRAGADRAAEVTRLAASALDAGGVRTAAGRRTIEDMDRALRDPRHHGNPGTTADLTAAGIFVVLLGGGWVAQGRSSDANGGIDAAPR